MSHGATEAFGGDLLSTLPRPDAPRASHPAPRSLAPQGEARAPRPESVRAKAAHEGHRKRLVERFLSGGALPDYELLEIVLFAVDRRADTKLLAKELLKRYRDDLAAIVDAPVEELRKVEIDLAAGGGEPARRRLNDGGIAALKAARALSLRLLAPASRKRVQLTDPDQLRDYCRAAMAHAATEQCRVLFLDRKNHLKADEIMQRGTVDQAPIYPREVVKRALELGACAIILVHNHPSGDPTPSRADIETTRLVQQAAAALGIAVHDHLIVGRDGHASMRRLGLM